MNEKTVRKTKAAKAQILPIPKSKQSKGKTINEKKLSIKSVVIAFVIFCASVIIWQWYHSSKTAPTTPEGVQTGSSAAVVSAPPGGDPATLAGLSTTNAGAAAVKNTAVTEGADLIIADVRITPNQPMATDTLKAVVSLAGGDATGITLTYQWKINDQAVFEATDIVLKDKPLKRRDRVSVVVTAVRDGVAGPSTESKTVVIYSQPPSLDMKIDTPQIRLGLPIEIQLSSTAPDGDKIVYSLTAPFLDGMTINGNTGKISWTPQRVIPGKLKFGAAATDTDGNKTMKVFELDMGIEAGQ